MVCCRQGATTLFSLLLTSSAEGLCVFVFHKNELKLKGGLKSTPPVLQETFKQPAFLLKVDKQLYLTVLPSKVS